MSHRFLQGTLDVRSCLTARPKSSLRATALKDCMPLYGERFIFIKNTHHPEAIWKFLVSVKNNSNEIVITKIWREA